MLVLVLLDLHDRHLDDQLDLDCHRLAGHRDRTGRAVCTQRDDLDLVDLAQLVLLVLVGQVGLLGELLLMLLELRDVGSDGAMNGRLGLRQLLLDLARVQLGRGYQAGYLRIAAVFGILQLNDQVVASLLDRLN